MEYENCESAKDSVRMCLVEKKLSLFKEVANFSIIIISFKIGFIVTVKFSFFRHFWFRTSCMCYADYESAKDSVRMCLVEKKLSLFKEVANFSIIIISFKIGFIVTVKFSFFRHFWFRTSCMGYVNCESVK